MALFKSPSVQSVDVSSPFYTHVRSLVRGVTLPAVIDSLKTSGRFYSLSWRPENAPKAAHCFWDSDGYKTMEACCYFLMSQNDEHIRNDVETYVGFVKNAQWEDGYVNSYYTLHEPENRFTNLRDMHELYCLGHLAEFAVAYHALTTSQVLIDVVRRYVELLHKTIIPKGGYGGHEELELALMRVYDVTKDDLFLDTVSYLVRERGKQDAKGLTYYDHESIARGQDPFSVFNSSAGFRKARDYAYMQAGQALVDQQEIDGHCVRAVYFLTGALHYALTKPNESQDILDAVFRLFDDVTLRKMYVTGGMGSVTQNEGFGPVYHLPDLQQGGGCYSETCASFGLIVLCQRLLHRQLHARYADIMERAMMNCVLGALGMEGRSFYYENPLATLAGEPWRRSKWFDTACCPPNIVKIWGLLPSLIYSVRDDTIAVHLYIGSSFTTVVNGEDVTIDMESCIPWAENVKIKTQNKNPLRLALRIPDWAGNDYKSSANGDVSDGYLYLDLPSSTTIELRFPKRPKFVYPHPLTRKDEIAIARGPLVYCAENPDNDFSLDAAYVSPSSQIREVGTMAIEGVKDVPILEVDALVRTVVGGAGKELYSMEAPEYQEEVKSLRLIPYFLRENRGGNGEMRVWLRKLNGQPMLPN